MSKFIKLEEDKDINIEPADLELFYRKYFAYYNTLSTSGKTTFIRRSLKLLQQKEIEGVGGFRPDNRVKALVAASSVQLTLGLETWSLDYFDSIYLYANDFNDTPRGLLYSGETSLAGYIRLSWKSFLKGYSLPNDKINLGLHEFSHALRFNDVKGHGQDYFVDNYFDSWLASAYEAYYDVRNGRKTIFRKYGGTNINEFTSVCIEHFFEAPDEIKEHYPLLYYSTAILLNQLPGSNTRLNIREEMLRQKSQVMKGFTALQLSGSFRQSATSRMLLVVLAPLVFTVISTGFISGPSLFLELLVALLLLQFDYRYTSLEITHKEFMIDKGAWLFRRRSQSSKPIACLISFRNEEESPTNTGYEIIYYDTGSAAFYSENVYAPHHNHKLLQELGSNRVATYRR